MVAPRKTLEALLKPKLPKTWKIVPYQDNIDTPSTTVVMFKQRTIIRTPAAPQGAHDIEFIVTIISAREDPQKAEDELDDQVNALIHAIDELGILWETATKVLATDRLAYDITLTLTSTKE